MKKDINEIDFDSIDLSDFQEEVNEIRQDIERIKKNKKMMKILKKVDAKLNKRLKSIEYNNNRFKNIDKQVLSNSNKVNMDNVWEEDYNSLTATESMQISYF